MRYLAKNAPATFPVQRVPAIARRSQARPQFARSTEGRKQVERGLLVAAGTPPLQSARPAVLNGFCRVPLAFRVALQFVEQRAQVEPRQLCSSLLHKCTVWPGLGESPHVLRLRDEKPRTPSGLNWQRMRAFPPLQATSGLAF